MSDGQRVFVVDDDASQRSSLRWLLESVGLDVVTYGSAPEFLEGYEANGPCCLVLDVRMPGMDGLALQEALNKLGVRIPVIVITGHGDVPVAVRAMKAGAFDFIQKPFHDQVLLERIQLALQHSEDAWHQRQRQEETLERLERLTPREREVMELVVDGLPNKRIAARLSLSEKTVEVHRGRVMRKLEVSSLADLVRLALSAQK